MSESTVRLGEVATARSGDKGNDANIGVVAKHEPAFRHLVQYLTEERVREFFSGTGVTRVKRFELPKVWALNFVLYNSLAGGASQSLRIDSQGKLFGTAILELRLPSSTHV